ncbi:MAG TPA: type II toxin-antitoxin system PemK/MazF family toxin [Cyanobacteria bacterium UBA11162]|nr:type II toxin-antitoxin system PemK/MazF family toxin [Cyanobacteria bacterium UBA11162]
MPKGILSYRRGDICWVNLDPTKGVETKKTRPCLIVQNDQGNRFSLLTVVMPILPGNKEAPYVVNVKATLENGLDRDRYIDVGQIRAVAHERIGDKLGVIEIFYWQSIQDALDIVLGFDL